MDKASGAVNNAESRGPTLARALPSPLSSVAGVCRVDVLIDDVIDIGR
jgi:hypothetical protein